VRFSPDGALLATGGGEPSRSGEIHLWRVAEGALWKEFSHVHSDAVLSLDFTPDGAKLASGAADRFARVTEIESGKVIRALEGHTHHVTGVSWKSDGRTLMTAGADNVIKVWNTLTGERKKNVDGFNKEVTSVQFMGLGDQAVAASGDGQVRLINEKGERVREFPGATDYVNAVLVTPDGQVVAAGGQDGVLRVWDGAEGRLRNAFAPPADR
jgi:WD40 repeat protein